MRGFIFPYRAKVLQKQKINHNVMRLHIERPYGYSFTPGQAIDLSIDRPGYELDVAPFTIFNAVTSSILELIIKIRPNKNSLTHSLAKLDKGAVLQIGEPWDIYKYKGRGIFIAAGSGITPFIPILNDLSNSGMNLKENHKFIYANKQKKDILFQSELNQLFAEKCIHVLSAGKEKNMLSGRVDSFFLNAQIKDLNQYFYICGPKTFEHDVRKNLLKLGVKKRYIQTGYNF
tara:strand:- start:1661 stop:2353 length:693 start_codon:yes stop_codon:yes gene_type:complete